MNAIFHVIEFWTAVICFSWLVQVLGDEQEQTTVVVYPHQSRRQYCLERQRARRR